jgi:hypothetical protein
MTAEILSAAFGGKRNPKQVLADALGEAEKIEAVLICVRYSDGAVRFAWNDFDAMVLVGLAATAIDDINNHQREPA